MRIISHRGNIRGPGGQCDWLDVEAALLEGYDVELDVREVGRRLWIGHDEPLYELPREWVGPDVAPRLWFHAKDAFSFDALRACGHRAFQHEDEPFAVVEPEGVKWLHPKGNSRLFVADLDGHVLLDIEGYPRVPRGAFSATAIVPHAVCTDWPREWH